MRICFLVWWLAVMGITGLTVMPSALAETPAASAQPARRDLVSTASVVRVDARTGHLVRSTVVITPKTVSPKPAAATSAPVTPAPAKAAVSPKPVPDLLSSNASLAEIIDQMAAAHQVDPLLVHSVIKVESNYNPKAVSRKGAQGLMQLIPSTAKRFGVTDSFDPRQNVEAGVKYLKYLQDVFKDDRLALAAYNAGEGAVAKYGWIPPYPETQNYVYQVGKKYGDARRAAAQSPAKPEAVPVKPEPPVPPAEQHPRLEQYVDDQGRIHLRTVQ